MMGQAAGWMLLFEDAGILTPPLSELTVGGSPNVWYAIGLTNIHHVVSVKNVENRMVDYHRRSSSTSNSLQLAISDSTTWGPDSDAEPRAPAV